MPETTEHILRLGESVTVRQHFFKAGIEVIYAGGVTPDTYSIAVKWSRGNHMGAYNLYFSDRQRDILLPSGKITVINVSGDKILFKYQPN